MSSGRSQKGKPTWAAPPGARPPNFMGIPPPGMQGLPPPGMQGPPGFQNGPPPGMPGQNNFMAGNGGPLNDSNNPHNALQGYGSVRNELLHILRL